jgi:hypothetical protein
MIKLVCYFNYNIQSGDLIEVIEDFEFIRINTNK